MFVYMYSPVSIVYVTYLVPYILAVQLSSIVKQNKSFQNLMASFTPLRK